MNPLSFIYFLIPGSIAAFIVYLLYVSIIAIAYNRNPERYFKPALFLAKRGWYDYDGSIGFAKLRGVPCGRVKYPDGKSQEMALTTCVSYANMFGGEVLPMEKK